MHPEIAEYNTLLAPDGLPAFVTQYAAAPAMRRLRGIGLFCGTDYSRLYNPPYFYSRYDHSLAAALLVWRFTKDKKQALSALFHDIDSPVFSHCVDFMNGDALTQESTEAGTSRAIEGDGLIMRLLARDGLALSDVDDYHRYPIADNDSPRLSADRLEYTLSTGLVWRRSLTPADIRFLLARLAILEAEDGQPEIGFTAQDAAERFGAASLDIGKAFMDNKNKVSLQLLGDILKTAIAQGVLTVEALYQLTEAEAIARLQSAPGQGLRDAWAAYTHLHAVHGAQAAPAGKYSVRIQAKRRYINPLVQTPAGARRLSAVSGTFKAALATFLAWEDLPYGYVDFTFTPAALP